MIFRRPSLGWAKAKLPARAKPASAEIADRITAPPYVPRRITIRINRALEARPLPPRESWCPAARARRDRPCGSGAAEQHDEVAAFHCPIRPVLRTERIAQLGTAGDRCTAGFQSAYVRFGSFTAEA